LNTVANEEGERNEEGREDKEGEGEKGITYEEES
jgi:hypothetical protein